MSSPVAKALAGHTVAYGLTTVLSRASAVVLLIVLPLLIRPADYGVLGLIMAANAVCITAVPLEVTQTVARFYPNASPHDQAGYASSAWWFTLASLIATAALVAVVAAPIAARVFGDARYAVDVRIASVLVIVNGLFYFVQNQLRWSFRIRDFAIVSLLFSAATLALGLLFTATLPDRLGGVLIGQAVGGVAAVGLGLWFLRDTLSMQIDTTKLREMLRVSVPLVPASLALMVNLYAGRVILSDLATLRDVGLFTYANQIAGLTSLVIIGFQGSLIPLVMSHHEHPDTPVVLARSFENFIVVAIAACLFIGLLAPEAIGWFGNPAYAPAAHHVLPLAFAAVLGQLYIFGLGFLIAKRTIWQAGVAVTAAILCIAANYLLIPMLGISGAVLAAVMTTAAYSILWFTLSQRLYPIPVRWWRVVGLAVVAGGGGLVLNGGIHLPVWALAAKIGWVAAVPVAGAMLRLFAWRTLFAVLTGAGRRTRPAAPDLSAS